MKNNRKRLNVVFFGMIFGLILFFTTTCEGPMGPQGEKGEKGDQAPLIIERASFVSLTANGDEDNTTTILTLTFDMDIIGLNSADITIIDNGSTGTVKGPVNRIDTGVYNMAVYGITTSGEITVIVSKPAYVFDSVYRIITLHFNALSTPTFTNIDAMSVYLEGLTSNYIDNPQHIILSGLNFETDFMFNSDSLGKLYNAIKGKYVALDLRGCTGQFIPNTSDNLANARPYSYIVSILLPDTLTAIGDNAFYWFNGHLLMIKLPASLISIGNSTFSRNYLATINLPNTLTTIGDYAFYHSWSLATINLPNTLTTIGSFVFAHCHSLTTVNLPNTLTTIGERAFQYCSSLATINLPASLTAIDGTAFLNCTSLNYLICNAISPPEIIGGANSTLFEIASITIKVPAGSVAAYKAAPGWSNYANGISAIE